ncbi:hypothetical protein ATANTOWER_007402 [Ataeniobius toweri]|uniref:Uncharacterized protein n=1 Tax=Ataeniobius toweri TaxID=208326 RepID=A0ABU7C8D5_9TELE|nr:hypothetical protein [Ataeniobius toweri]
MCLEFNSSLKLKVIHKTCSNCGNNDKTIYYYWVLQYLKTSPTDCPIDSKRTYASDHLVLTFTSADFGPKWPHVPVPVIPEPAALAPCSGLLEEKNASGCVRLTQVSQPNHPPPTTALIKTAASTNQSPSDSSFRLN